MSRRAQCLAAVLLLASSSYAVAAPVIGGGGTLVAGPWDSDYNYAIDAGITGVFGDPATGLQAPWTIGANTVYDALTHRASTSGQFWTWIENTSDLAGPPAFVQWNNPAAFTVGTIITDVVKFSYTDPSSDANYTFKASAGNPGTTTAAWSAVPSAGSGGTAAAVSTSQVNVHTLPAAVSANTLRMEFSETTVRPGTNSHAFIDEVVVFPERYAAIPVNNVTASGEGFPKERVADGDTQTRWFHQTGGDEYVQLNFGSTQTVNALVVYTYNGFPSDFTITDDASNVLATVSNVMSGSDLSEVIAITLNSPASTSSLRFTMTTNQVDGVGGLTEIIPLTLVPEPTAAALLALGSAVLLHRRRQA